MDLKEVKGLDIKRHPWELARLGAQLVHLFDHLKRQDYVAGSGSGLKFLKAV